MPTPTSKPDAVATPSGARSRSAPARGVLYACIVLCMGVLASLAAALEADRTATQRDAVRFERFSDRLRTEIERRLNLYTYGLRAVSGLWLASEAVDGRAFAAVVGQWDLEQQFPGAVAMGYIEAVPHEELGRLESELHRQGVTGFNVRSDVAVSTHLVVKYIEPIASNQPELGLDLATDEVRADALWRAAASGEPTLSEPLELIQAPREGLGLVYVLPVYRPHMPLRTQAERTAAVRGWVSMPIVLGRALGRVADAVNGEVDVTVYGEHADADADASVMFFSGRDRQAGTPVATHARLEHSETLRVGGQNWIVRFSTSPTFTRASRAAVWALGGAGSALSLALGGLVLSLATTAARARALASEMTASLRESESRFRNMADAAPVLIWSTDAAGAITHLSKRWCDFTGLPLDHLTGTRWLDRVHPDDVEHVRAALQQSVGARDPLDLEFRLCDAAGEWRWLVDRGLPRFGPAGVFLGFVGGCMDITERREAEQALGRERARLAAFVEHAPAAVAMFDRHMRYIAVSHRWLAEYKLEGADVLGRSHYEVFPGMPARWMQIHARCLQGAVERCDDDVWRPAGWLHDQHLRWEVRPWREPDGTIGGVMMYTRDITAEIAVLQDLADARQRAEEASRAKSGFLANMSHEIRTPMTAIMGFADLLDDEHAHPLTPSERSGALRTIKRNGQHLLALINDILDVSKIEAGKMSVEAITTDPAAIVADVCTLMQVRAAGKRLRLDMQFDTPVPRTITSDPVRLKQILVNLVGNAIKFTEAGGVRVRVAYDAAAPASPTLRFVVTDTGIGMSEAQCAQLFSPFSQADETMTRKFGGTGLGLTICARLAQMLGGSITVNSTPGRGSTFTLCIAALGASDDRMLEPASMLEADLCSAPPTDATGASGALDGLRILLAEDGPDNQRLLRFHLERAGATVTTVERGDEAVLASTPGSGAGATAPFDLILMDMQMPVMDGYTAAATLRARGCTTPIVAVTAHAMQGDREKCLAAGCDEYCTKPIDRAGLLRVCARLAGGACGGRSAASARSIRC